MVGGVWALAKGSFPLVLEKIWRFFVWGLVLVILFIDQNVDWVFRWFRMDFGVSLTWLVGGICGGIWGQPTKMPNWRVLSDLTLFFNHESLFSDLSCGNVCVNYCIPTSLYPCLWVQECLVDKFGQRNVVEFSSFCRLSYVLQSIVSISHRYF